MATVKADCTEDKTTVKYSVPYTGNVYILRVTDIYGENHCRIISGENEIELDCCGEKFGLFTWKSTELMQPSDTPWEYDCRNM